MSATDAMHAIGQEREWTVEIQLEFALLYIDNQNNDDAFRDFLEQCIDLEDDYLESAKKFAERTARLSNAGQD